MLGIISRWQFITIVFSKKKHIIYNCLHSGKLHFLFECDWKLGLKKLKFYYERHSLSQHLDNWCFIMIKNFLQKWLLQNRMQVLHTILCIFENILIQYSIMYKFHTSMCIYDSMSIGLKIFYLNIRDFVGKVVPCTGFAHNYSMMHTLGYYAPNCRRNLFT